MKTSNYQLFALMQNNRQINEGLVNRLIKSISEIGYVDARPIIVSPNYVIIDGQHRFEACKRINIPIVYEISHVDMDKAMISLNMNQQIWRLGEYVNSYAKSGVQCYIDTASFENQYGFGFSNTLVICASGTMGSLKAEGVRNGKEFNINPKRHEIARFILACKPLFSFYLTKPFVVSVESLFRKTTAENCAKVLSKIHPLKQQVSAGDYLSF
jgi:hypothetical protein